MIDQSAVGRAYPLSPVYEVGREKIREFAEALRDDNPVYRDPEAARALGYRDVIAPPTFAVTFASAASRQVTDDPELGVDYARVVHGEQRFVWTRPVTAGDRLQVLVTIDAIRVAAGNEMITTKGDVITESGEPVLTVYSLLVVRGAGTAAA
jgi:acyl dehydratase